MKRNIWILALLVAVIALAALVVRQNQQIKQAKEQPPIAAVTEEPKAPPASVPARRTAKPAPLSEPGPSESISPTSSAAASAPEPAVQANASTGSVANLSSLMAGMMKNPQMKEMVRAQQKMVTDQMYGLLSKYLNLSADQVDALKNLLLERQLALVDASLSAMSGPESDRKQAAEDVKAITADYEQKIKELLGPQDYQVFQGYEKTSSERMQVQMFKGALPADTMLTDQQEYDLISAMYEARSAMPSLASLNTRTSDPSQLTEDRIAEIQKQMEQLQKVYADRAATILNPAQLEQFTKFQEQWSSMQTMGLKMASQMFGNKSAPQTPGAGQPQTP